LLFANDGAVAVSGRSTDGNALAAALDETAGSLRDSKTLRNPGPESVLSAAGINWNATNKPGRKLLVWVGRRWPFPSWPDPTWHEREIFKDIIDLSTLLRETHTTLYSVFLGDFDSRWYGAFLKGVTSPREATIEDIALPVVAIQSGGRAAGPSYDLAGQIESCIADARFFYTISFEPPRPDRANEYHDLKVRVGTKGLTARTNTGYYNQPELGLKYITYSDDGQRLPESHGFLGMLGSGQPVTVGQLDEILKAAQAKPDAEAARQLSGLSLTERMSTIRLSSWKAGVPGTKTWAALVALADASAFLDPPKEEATDLRLPDISEQRLMLAHSIDYLKMIIPKLPNFFATRTTVLYETAPLEENANESGLVWREVTHAKATVLYRQGEEVVEPEGTRARNPNAKENGLVTTGTFGLILYKVFTDAARSQLTWSHWEHSAAGSLAVFRFAVPIEKSSYDVGYLTPLGADKPLQQTGYHGEFAINPETGAILRLKVEADLNESTPLVRADIMVEYGPIEIGGKTYICPVRSVSISRSDITLGPELTRMNDVVFGNYHVFRSESRILPADPSVPNEK
jgi:hypothetical protein